MITVRSGVHMKLRTLRTNMRLLFPNTVDMVSVFITYFKSPIDTGGRLMVLGVVREFAFFRFL